MPLESRNDQRRQVVVLLLFGVLTVLVASKLGQIGKTRQKLEQKKSRKIDGLYLCLQQFNNFCMCSAENDGETEAM